MVLVMVSDLVVKYPHHLIVKLLTGQLAVNACDRAVIKDDRVSE